MFTKKAKDNLQAMLGQAKFSAANNTDAQALRVPSLYPEWISIHAPAKGATAFINIFSLAVRLFFISSHQ